MTKIMLLIGLALSLLATGCAKDTAYRFSDQPDVSLGAEMYLDEDDPNRLANLEPEMLIHRGDSQLASGNTAMARLYYSAALTKDPEQFDALVGLGRVELKEGRYRLAERSFRKALEASPEDAELHAALAKTLRGQEKHEDAVDHFDQAMTLRPGDATYSGEMAISLEAMGLMDEAEKLFQQAVNENPNSPNARNNLGFHYLIRGKFSNAVDELARAHRMQPDAYRITNNLAVAYAMIGEDSLAFELFASTVGEAAAHNNMGYLHMIRGQSKESERSLEQALEIEPRLYVRAMENWNHLMQRLETQPKEQPATH